MGPPRRPWHAARGPPRRKSAPRNSTNAFDYGDLAPGAGDPVAALTELAPVVARVKSSFPGEARVGELAGMIERERRGRKRKKRRMAERSRIWACISRNPIDL